MTIDFLSLTHENIKHITPYQPGGHIETLREKIHRNNIIKLASNENPLGVSEQVTSSLNNLDKIIPFYPDSHATELKNALSSFYDIPSDTLLPAAGSEEIIRLLIQAFNRSDKKILFPQYAFIAYKLSCQAVNARFEEIPSPNYQIDITNVIKACKDDASLLFIANPNNPTGDYIDQSSLELILKSIPSTTLLVLDEAYYEYAREIDDYPDSLALQKSYPNLVILRTFSKAYGLAGLRVGYCIAHPQLIDVLNRVKLAFNVSCIAQSAATTALSDQSFIQHSLEVNAQGKKQLSDAINELGYEHIPSSTNFITVNFNHDTQPLFKALQQEGIMVRTLHPYGMPTWLRISIGIPEQNEYLIEQLRLRS